MKLIHLHRHGCLGFNDALLGCLCLFMVCANNALVRTTGGVLFCHFLCFCHSHKGGGYVHLHPMRVPRFNGAPSCLPTTVVTSSPTLPPSIAPVQRSTEKCFSVLPPSVQPIQRLCMLPGLRCSRDNGAYSLAQLTEVPALCILNLICGYNNLVAGGVQALAGLKEAP